MINDIKINGLPLEVRIRQRSKNENGYKVFLKQDGLKQEYLCSSQKSDLENKIEKIMNQIEFAYKLHKRIEFDELISVLKEEFASKRNSDDGRLILVSDDGLIKMFVRYNANENKFRTWVLDEEVGTNELKEGYLFSPVITEAEAERIVQEQMELYNSEGYYIRRLTNGRTPRIKLKHEVMEDELTKEEYSIQGLTKEEYIALNNYLTKIIRG